MSKEHAMRFPLVGSAMLLSLFLLFKFLSKDLVNAVLTAYFFVLGIVALSYVLILIMHLLCCFLFCQVSWYTVYVLCSAGRRCCLPSAGFCQNHGMIILSSGAFLISNVRNENWLSSLGFSLVYYLDVVLVGVMIFHALLKFAYFVNLCVFLHNPVIACVMQDYAFSSKFLTLFVLNSCGGRVHKVPSYCGNPWNILLRVVCLEETLAG